MEDDEYPFSIYELKLLGQFRGLDVYVKILDKYDDREKIFKFLEDKLGDSLSDIYESDYVPIKMTQTCRPNMTEIEYNYFIRPWIKERVKNSTLSWEKSTKKHMGLLIKDLKATVNEINRAGDLSKYNYEAIMKCIDRLEY